MTLYGSNWAAQTFTTTSAHTVSSVNLKLLRVGNPGTLTVSISEVDGSEHPTGTDLTSGTYNGNLLTAGGDWCSVTVTPEYPLEANKEYAVIVRAVAGDVNNTVGWRYNNGTYTNGTYETSTNGGATWTANTSRDFLFSIWGNEVMEVLDAKVFSGYQETGDWLVTVYYKNEYPPYYGNAGEYFDLQLVANGSVVAQTKLPGWGCKPASIYLSKAMADTLEWGSPYTITMYGRFGSNPTASRTLISSDWMGTDLRTLDSWVLGTANKMGLYYDVTLTTFKNSAEVLNEVGGTYFVMGIPLLDEVRPNIFEYPPLITNYPTPSFNHTYENSFDWQALLGPDIVNVTTDVGSVTGLTPIHVAQVALFGTWLLAVAGLVTVIGTPALFASIPFLFIGIYTGLITLTVFAIVGSVVTLVLVWMFWLSRS